MDLFFKLWFLVLKGIAWFLWLFVRAFVLSGKFGCWLLRRTSNNFGSSRWATRAEIERAGLLKGRGPIIGKVGFRALRYNDKEGHMAVFAPTRSGKGTGPVISTILDYPGSLVILDPKGENYAITNKYRRTLGPVYRINLEDHSESDWYNPFDMIRLRTHHEIPDAENLTDICL